MTNETENPQNTVDVKSIEESIVLAGYHSSQKMYFFYAALVCLVIPAILFWFKGIIPSPIWIVVASFMIEACWRHRYLLSLKSQGLEYGKNSIPWDKIYYYAVWGPVGIPLTPFQLQGVVIFLKNGQTLYVGGRSPGYALLLQRLSRQNLAESKSPVWHHYPGPLIRTLRYTLAISFSILFHLWQFFQGPILIVVALVICYWMLQIWKKSRYQSARAFGKYFGFIVAITILSGVFAYFILKGIVASPICNFLLGILPVIMLIWFPWQPAPVMFLQHHDVLLVGRKRAYSLRYLKTSQNKSKLLFIKVWRLNFLNGRLEIFPFLEKFKDFQQKVDRHWETMQDKYQQNPLSVRSPREEARQLRNVIPSLKMCEKS